MSACRAGCGTPLDASLIEHDGAGLHPSCIAPVRPLLPELTGILGRYQNNSARSRQLRVGPSEIGVACDRELAYRVFASRPEEGLKWAPLVGSWGHEGMALALAAENALLGRERYLIERRVRVSPELDIAGTTDCYDTDVSEVIDWKFTGKTAMTKYRRYGPGQVYRTQAHLYALGWQNEGVMPRSVRLVFLPRWSHLLSDGHEWAEPYQRGIADDALARLARIRSLGARIGLPWQDEGFELIPGLIGENCAYCPYRRRGGPADGTGCPGNTEELHERAAASFGKGLVA